MHFISRTQNKTATMKLIPLIFPVGGSGLKPIRGDSRFIAQLLSHLSSGTSDNPSGTLHPGVYSELCAGRHLKTKHHFMLHYPEGTSRLGPVVPSWCTTWTSNSHEQQYFYNAVSTQTRRHGRMIYNRSVWTCHTADVPVWPSAPTSVSSMV